MSQDITVIGAGIIGISIALRLAQQGHRVRVIDRKGVAAETSQGNAGRLRLHRRHASGRAGHHAQGAEMAARSARAAHDPAALCAQDRALDAAFLARQLARPP